MTWAAVTDATTGATNRFPLIVSGTVSAVPEPATWVLTALAGVAVVAARRRASV